MLRLADAYVWDSWIADDGELYHLFFLMAPRSLGDSGLRHANATVGHATSADLVDWEFHGEALGPSSSGWDDLATWTGSVARGDDGVWRMFYTAINSGGHGLRDQRIGMVESDDLFTWRRTTPQPIVSPDTRWYRTLDEDPAASETWRDPFVFRGEADEDGGGWRMLICARVAGGARNDDGVLAEARSDDLVRWTLGPPVTEPGTGFGQLEVAQVRRIGEDHVLVFTCHPQEQTDERIARVGSYSTWSVTGPSPDGPWDIDRAVPFTGEPRLFAAPLVQARDGRWMLVGFRNLDAEGIESLELLDPIPVVVDRSLGGLVVAGADGFKTDAAVRSAAARTM